MKIMPLNEEAPVRELQVGDIVWTVLHWNGRVLIRYKSPRGQGHYYPTPQLDFQPPPSWDPPVDATIPNEILLGARELYDKLTTPTRKRNSRWSFL